MMPESEHFSNRLAHIIGPRRPYPWAQSLGITRGSINRMLNEGHIPGGDILARLAQVESCSITWLLTGQGAPYLVHRTASDAETAERLRAHLADEAWQCHVLEDGRRGVIVLAQPAELGEGEEAVRYTAVELIAGPWGPETAGILAPRVDGATRVAPAVIDDAHQGRLGAYGALSVLADAAARESDAGKRVARIAESYGGRAHTPEEQAWLDAWHRLSPASRTHARAVVDALAHQGSCDAKEGGTDT
jgi:transcriptional regulator with XRE-family HTH domain